MARERSEMRQVKEVLRLRLAFGLSHKAIGAACRMPRTTVRDYCQRAMAAGLDSFAAVEPLSERALEARLFTTGVDPNAPDEDAARPPAGRPTPDWAVVHRELNKPGVTRILLWQESLEGLSPGWTDQGDDAGCRRVHAPFPAAHAPKRLSAHPVLWPVRERSPGRSAAALSAASRGCAVAVGR